MAKCNKVISSNCVRIYHSRDPRNGFELPQCSSPYLDESLLAKLIEQINKLFLNCSNLQTQCLLKSESQGHDFLNILCVLMLLPILKYLITGNPEHILLEYTAVIVYGSYELVKYFQTIDYQKEKYLVANEELERKFTDIQNDFNSRFSYLQMFYRHKVEDDDIEFLEIRIKRASNSSNKGLRTAVKLPQLK